jgi:hypothetical protein
MIYDSTYGSGGPLEGRPVRIVEFGTGDIAMDVEEHGNNLHLNQLKVAGPIGQVSDGAVPVDPFAFEEGVGTVILKFDRKESAEALKKAVEYIVEKWTE